MKKSNKQSSISSHLKAGHKILPVQSNNKKPYYNDLKTGEYNKDIKQYRERELTKAEVKSIIKNKLNYGVITDENFIIIDIDERSLATHIIKQLQNENIYTYTVETRRGYHIYLYSSQYTFSSLKNSKIDVIKNGSYVLGAGSKIEDFEYKQISNDREVVKVTRNNIEAIRNALEDHLKIRIKKQSIKQVVFEFEKAGTEIFNAFKGFSYQCLQKIRQVKSYTKRYKSRSECEQSAIFEMVNLGYSLNYLKAIFDQTAPEESKYQEKNREERRKYLKHSYQKAKEHKHNGGYEIF